MTGPVDTTQAADDSIAKDVWNWGLPEKDGEPGGPGPNERAWVRIVLLGDALARVETDLAQIKASMISLGASEVTDHADLLAAVKAIPPGGTPTDAQVAALGAALGPDVVAALAAKLTAK